MTGDDSKLMKVSDLAFDRENPRLRGFDLAADASDSDVIKLLWDAMDVRELVMSIASSGFFRHDPLIVVPEDKTNVVIEGNRRLAAVKVLLSPALAETVGGRIPSIDAPDRHKLEELPVVISDTREAAWHYLGFKHVNGPAKWSSYAKSRYIADVHRKYGVPLDDIAKQIGDTHQTVNRLYRGLVVLEQAERLKVFDRQDRHRKHFSFSHLYTGLDYKGISVFVGLPDEIEGNEDPVPPDKQEELRELCLWLFGSKKEDIQPSLQRQNPDLRHLNAVVQSIEAVSALRNGDTLEEAYAISRPPTNVFQEYLISSKRNLVKARSLVTAGYDGTKPLLLIAATVAELADDLFRDMERKRMPGKKKRFAEDS